MKTFIINMALMGIVPFVFNGIITRVKALWSGRKGAPILQPLYDFVKLLKKGEVISYTTTGIFGWAPVISFCAVIGAGALVPMSSGAAIAGFDGDFILFAYLLALAKFLSLASAMDTGSSFEGMGAGREAAFSSFVEPAFFILIAASAAVSGTAGFSGIRAAISAGSAGGALAAAIAAAALFIMMLVEGCRVPVDDPNTHLELTMIHEAMVLDNSGPSMAIISYTAGLKMFLVSSLLANFLMPLKAGPWVSAVIYAAVVAATAVLTGCVESLIARLRMTHVPQFVFFMTTLAVAVFFIVLIFIPGGVK